MAAKDVAFVDVLLMLPPAAGRVPREKEDL
jgi:hypothetical protein